MQVKAKKKFAKKEAAAAAAKPNPDCDDELIPVRKIADHTGNESDGH